MFLFDGALSVPRFFGSDFSQLVLDTGSSLNSGDAKIDERTAVSSCLSKSVLL